MHKSSRGFQVPDSGDDLLTSFESSLESVGGIGQFQSVAAMRSALASLEAAGNAVTPANPLFGDIGGVMYRSDGSKTTNGTYILRPFNEVDYSETNFDKFPDGQQGKRLNSNWEVMCRDKLPVRNYDRVAMAFGQCALIFGDTSSSGMNVGIKIQGQDGQIARITTISTLTDATCMNIGRIPAGVDPNIEFCCQGIGYVTLSGNAYAQRLEVMAFPISMS